MTVYYTERTLGNEIAAYLRKLNRRGIIESNTYENIRAGNIDYHLLLEYFDLAVAKEKDIHNPPTNVVNLPAYQDVWHDDTDLLFGEKLHFLKEHTIYKVAITLPIDLEDRIPFWFVKSDGQTWVDPNSGPKGFNVYKENVFTVRFTLYTDKKRIDSLPDTRDIPVKEGLIREFRQIRRNLIEGEEEAIDIFKGIYGGEGQNLHTKTQAGEYLINILAPPH